MSRCKVHRILQALQLKPYKIQHQKYIIGMTIYTAEVSFHVNGPFNRPNCRLWSEENLGEFEVTEREGLEGLKTQFCGPFLP